MDIFDIKFQINRKNNNGVVGDFKRVTKNRRHYLRYMITYSIS